MAGAKILTVGPDDYDMDIAFSFERFSERLRLIIPTCPFLSTMTSCPGIANSFISSAT